MVDESLHGDTKMLVCLTLSYLKGTVFFRNIIFDAEACTVLRIKISKLNGKDNILDKAMARLQGGVPCYFSKIIPHVDKRKLRCPSLDNI